MKSLISIIIPTKNEAAVIEKTLKNLIAGLKNTNYEIIISDGSSTDRTVEIAKKYTNKIVAHTSAERQTIAAGRNAGARAAHGEFLVFLDADVSIPVPEIFFKKAESAFVKNPSIIAATVLVKVLPESATFMDNVVYCLFNYFNLLLNNIIKTGGAAGEFQMIRSGAFNKINGYDEKLIASEDYDLFRRLAKIGRTYLIKDLTIYHSGRRAHKTGWPKLLWIWLANGFWVLFFKKAISKEWKEVR